MTSETADRDVKKPTLTLLEKQALPPAYETLVEVLENLLEEAKSGELQGLAVVCSWSNYGTSYGWRAPNHRHMLRLCQEMPLCLSDLNFAYLAYDEGSQTNRLLGDLIPPDGST
ncbi:MAG: hypothetical protein AAGI44_18270 [Pseudomonadota bacterium]